MDSGLCNRQLSHSTLYVTQTDRNCNLNGWWGRERERTGMFCGEVDQMGKVDEDLDLLNVLFLRGLLNCICRAVGRRNRTSRRLLHSHNSLRFYTQAERWNMTEAPRFPQVARLIWQCCYFLCQHRPQSLANNYMVFILGSGVCVYLPAKESRSLRGAR